MKSGLSNSILRLLGDPVGERALAFLSEEDLAGIAVSIASSDPYRDAGRWAAALKLTGAGGEKTRHSIEHQLWCARRQARWRMGLLKPQDLSGAIDVEGSQWLDETRDVPVVLISPMTLGTFDAVQVVTALAERACPGRWILFYGEGMEAEREVVPGLSGRLASGDGLDVLRRALQVFSKRGVFCTYPDFVYEGHAAVPAQLFGQARPMSTGFVYLATRPNVHLLPCLLERRDRRIVARLFEPVVLDAPVKASSPGLDYYALVAAQMIAAMLEGLIRLKPEQWLLMATLTHDAPEMRALAAQVADGHLSSGDG